MTYRPKAEERPSNAHKHDSGERRQASTDREIQLSPVPRAAGEAREFVHRQLTELGFPALVDSAAIIATELVANATKYAPQGPISLSLRLVSGRPLLEVRDHSPELPVFKEADFLSESGRGMHVVQAYAAALDWAAVPGGKVVRASL